MKSWMMVALVAAAVLVTAGGASAEANVPKSVKKVVVQRSKTVSESCPGHVAGLIFYRSKFLEHAMQMGRVKVDFTRPRNCARAIYLAHRWQKRAHRARVALEQSLAREREHILHDFVVRPGNGAWLKAIEEVQRAYPGTSGWLFDCSASEGGHGRWVGYGGVAYSPDYYGVGGWLQFMPGTWSGFYGHAVDDVRSRGFTVPPESASWTSPLGQALAGAWGITHGMGYHWAGSGC